MREFAHEFVDEFFANFVHEFKYEIREFVRIRINFCMKNWLSYEWPVLYFWSKWHTLVVIGRKCLLLLVKVVFKLLSNNHLLMLGSSTN